MNNNKPAIALLAALAMSLSSQFAEAGSATWKLNPTSGDWNTAANWMPTTVPNGPADTATFALSSVTALSLSANTEVNGVVFNSGASSFAIDVSTSFALTISGAGITNDSPTVQDFVTPASRAGSRGLIAFTNSATAGVLTAFTNRGAVLGFAAGGETDFFDTSAAGNAIFTNDPGEVTNALSGITAFFDSSTAGLSTFTNNGATASFANGGATLFFNSSSAGNGTFTNTAALSGLRPNDGGTLTTTGGIIEFHDSSSAANGTFTNEGAAASNATGGGTFFFDSSTAGDAVFTSNPATGSNAVSGQMAFFGSSTAGNAILTNNGADMNGVEAGFMQFADSSTAGEATIINNGGTVSGANGGEMLFIATSNAGAATLIANGGLDGGAGGSILFFGQANGGAARVKVFGNGNLDLSFIIGGVVRIGSIEGNGDIFLGSSNLGVGRNDLSTTFAGVIQDGGAFGGTGGALTKIGSGRLILSNANTYTGGTTITRGKLLVKNKSGSGTGKGPVAVDAGMFGGTGIIAGAVTLGTGSGTGAALAPGKNEVAVGTLTMLSTLTFNSDAVYLYHLHSAKIIGDTVIASGVTINNAQFSLADLANSLLPLGTVFTVIDNRAATPIAGNFLNLADGSIFAVGNNTFQASYEGGDGNDLTLTVVP